MTTSTAVIDNEAAIYQAADFVREYQWVVGGVAVPITSATIEAKFRASYNASPLFTATGSIVSANDGKFKITIPAATTAAATPVLSETGRMAEQHQPLFFDVMVTVGGLKNQVVRGVAKFFPSATR